MVKLVVAVVYEYGEEATFVNGDSDDQTFNFQLPVVPVPAAQLIVIEVSVEVALCVGVPGAAVGVPDTVPAVLYNAVDELYAFT